MANTYQPLGKLLLVRMHLTGSRLVLGDDAKYNHHATVLAVGHEVDVPLAVGDTVLLGGPQGIIMDSALGEDIALVSAAVVLARVIEAAVEPEVKH